MTESDKPIIDQAPLNCCICNAALCLRKQVVNLALGKTDKMMCLSCLAAENNQTPDEVLKSLKSYILLRDCFSKQWHRYKNVEYCPDKQGCFPDLCFSAERFL